MLDTGRRWIVATGGGDVVEGQNRIHLTDEQRIDWLRLIRSQNVGPRGIMAQTP
jgi:shikimate kinase